MYTIRNKERRLQKQEEENNKKSDSRLKLSQRVKQFEQRKIELKSMPDNV